MEHDTRLIRLYLFSVYMQITRYHAELSPWVAVIGLLVCLSGWAAAGLTAASTGEPTSRPASISFTDRRDQCIEAVRVEVERNEKRFSGSSAFFAAAAMFESGRNDAGCRLANRGLDNIEPSVKNRWIYGGNSGFTAWPGIDCYVRFSQHFDDALKDRFKRIYTGAVFYRRLSTSNHTIMAATTRYLATQVWGEESFKPDAFYVNRHPDDARRGTYFSANDRTGEVFLRQRIADAVHIGPGEYASRPYGAENILPFLTLAECAKDPELRTSARIAYEVCIAQLATTYLRGNLATFSTRSYPDMLSQEPWGVAALVWMYYGGVPPADPLHQWSMRAATADYRLPDTLLAAGTDRSKPYVARSLMNGWALYHFVNGSYALFSCSPRATHPKLLGQNYPCGVMWDEADAHKASQLWIANPAADAPDDGDANNRSNGIHTHGVTRFEQQLQHEDACLSVFNIDPNFRNPYVLGFIPGGYRACINDADHGQIFLHYGSVSIAITTVAPFEWHPEQPMRAPAGKSHPGDSEFRIPLTQTAVAVETASPLEFGGADAAAQLSAFKSALLGRSLIKWRTSAAPTAEYTDRKGNKLVSTFDRDDSINDVPVDYASWPILSNPWMQQSSPDCLSVSSGNITRTYNFTRWSIDETKH